MLPECDIPRLGRLMTLIGLARPKCPSPSLACNTRFEAVWAITTAPVQTPWTKLPETGGVTAMPLVVPKMAVPVKLVEMPLVRLCARMVTANGVLTYRGDGMEFQAK